MKILFTCFYFTGYHGSVMHICEIASYLAAKGHDVSCAAAKISARMKKYAKRKKLKLWPLDDVPLAEKFDLVWLYHYPVFPYLVERGLRYKKVINGCLSYTVPDTPGVWHAEDYTDLSLETPLLAKGIALYPANSEETCTKLEMLGIPKKKLYVLPNLCPDVFLNYSKLRKIAVVSNHVLQELKDLKLLAVDDGIRIDYYGVKGRCRPITPEILSHYDVVITIGKTVQYALGMGIPVFNYDYFGGAGYLTSANWAHEAFYNFSGRGTPIRCSGEELLEILKAGFENARFEALKLRKTAGEKYRLSKNVDALLREVQKLPDAEVVYEAGYGEKCRMVLANRLHKKKFWR